jgi:1-acyl-sn-glycerol-3-phosphate acyltransferase
VSDAAPGRLTALAFESLCRTFLRWGCDLEVRRDSPLPAGPFLLCSNHVSHADSVALMAASGLAFGECALLAARDYFFDRPMRRRVISSVLRLVPVERKLTTSGYQTIMDECRQLLRQQTRALIIYPEGSRQPGGALAPFKRLAAVLSATFELPIVPAFLSGTDKVLPRHATMPRTAPVIVRFGAPLSPIALHPKAGMRARAAELTVLLEQRIGALSAAPREEPWRAA